MKAARPFLFCIVLMMAVTAAAAAETQSGAKEERLWRMALAEQASLEQSRSLLRNAQLDHYLKSLVGRLWEFVESDLPPMTIRIIEDPEPNAVVYANGICYLTSGMLALVENEDQLAMIVAHELVHYIRRDSLEAFDLDAAAGTRGARTGEHFTAAAEKRADLEGMGLIRAAGYCPHAILELLVGFQNSKIPLMFSLGASPMSFGERIAGFETLLVTETADRECDTPPREGVEFRARTASALLANAEAAARRGIWETAGTSIADYLAIVTDNPQAHFIMGEVFLRKSKRDLQGAIDAFQRAIELDRKFLPAYRALGVLYLKEGHRSVARQFFEHHLAVAPEAPENSYIKGYLQLCQE